MKLGLMKMRIPYPSCGQGWSETCRFLNASPFASGFSLSLHSVWVINGVLIRPPERDELRMPLRWQATHHWSTPLLSRPITIHLDWARRVWWWRRWMEMVCVFVCVCVHFSSHNHNLKPRSLQLYQWNRDLLPQVNLDCGQTQSSNKLTANQGCNNATMTMLSAKLLPTLWNPDHFNSKLFQWPQMWRISSYSRTLSPWNQQRAVGCLFEMSKHSALLTLDPDESQVLWTSAQMCWRVIRTCGNCAGWLFGSANLYKDEQCQRSEECIVVFFSVLPAGHWPLIKWVMKNMTVTDKGNYHPTPKVKASLKITYFLIL